MPAAKAGEDQAEWDQSITALRAGLPAAAFEAAWAEGQAMSLEEAVRVALNESEILTTGGKEA